MAPQEVGSYEPSGRDYASTPSDNQVVINTVLMISLGNSVQICIDQISQLEHSGFMEGIYGFYRAGGRKEAVDITPVLPFASWY